MGEETKIREAFESLHAADDLYDQVMAREHGARRRRRGHALPMATALGVGAAAVLATAGVAGAIVTADPLFFMHAWGDHGLGGESSWDVYGGTDNDDYLYSITRSYEGVDAEAASANLEAAVEGVGLSCTLGNYTLTIDSMVVDSNGCGAATYTLANPEGVSYAAQYGTPGELILNGDDEDSDGIALDAIQMLLPHDSAGGFMSFADTCETFDQDASSATELHGTIYFATFGEPEELLQGVRWQLSGHSGTGDAQQNVDAETDEFRPSRVVETKAYEAPDAGTVKLSPMGLSFSMRANSSHEFVCDSVVLHLKDGSEHVVRDDADAATDNTYVHLMGNVGGDQVTTMVFSGLVDVSQVERIEISGGDDGVVETYEFTPVA